MKKKRKIKKTLSDGKYFILLNDYKDQIIKDLIRFNKDLTMLSIEWNCSNRLMKKRLNAWRINDWYNDTIDSTTKNKILKIYNKTKSICITAKRLHISYNTVKSKLDLFKIKHIDPNINKNYLKIINDVDKLKEFFFYFETHDKRETGKYFNISVYYVNKILAGEVKKNGSKDRT
jgi:histone H3/H4